MIQVTALALSKAACAHTCELAQRIRSSIIRLRRPTFQPSTTDRKRQLGHPCCLHHRKSTHEAAEASETFLGHVQTRPDHPRANVSRWSSSSALARDGYSSAGSCSLLLLPPVWQALSLPLWTSTSGEPVLARPTGLAGRMGSRGRPAEAVLGSDGGGGAAWSVYYKRIDGAGSCARDLGTMAMASGWCVLQLNLVAGGRTKASRVHAVAAVV